jgi:hypothetical protein
MEPGRNLSRRVGTKVEPDLHIIGQRTKAWQDLVRRHSDGLLRNSYCASPTPCLVEHPLVEESQSFDRKQIPVVFPVAVSPTERFRDIESFKGIEFCTG